MKSIRSIVGWLALVIFLAVAVGAGWGVAVWWPQQLEAVNPNSETTVRVEIDRGASTQAVARTLYAQGLIRNELVFRVYARKEGLDGRIKAGEYGFARSESLPELLDRLVAGDVITYSFTVPEGFRVEQVVQLLVEQGFGDREAFLKLVAEPSLVEEYYEGGEDVLQPLEGFLFPDTYTVTRDTTEGEIITSMVRRFERTFTDEWRQRATELGYSMYDIVTLASIIEKEARVDDERPIIAAVYHNRLDKGWRLQADPTVQYGLQDFGPLLWEDVDVDTAYNTYLHTGLPAGPIANPGEASLRAALYPADVPYMYFVACSDEGEHAFAVTNAEHNRNVARCRAE